MSKHLIEPNQIRLYYERPKKSELPYVSSPSVAISKLRRVLKEGVLDLKEHYWVLLLTADNHLLGISETNSGTIVGINLFAREIIQLALLSNAVNIVVVHNHPDGNLEPSQADIEGTVKLRELAKHFDVHLQDHLILTSEDYNSINCYL